MVKKVLNNMRKAKLSDQLCEILQFLAIKFYEIGISMLKNC